ncbi:MAG: hypothetical protein JRJ58_23040, partial [Deltaproteobacteria bacterium]|nr:hypothetical protein [Deltaproteobacteria bacterium]
HFAADLRDAQSRGELDAGSLAGSVESAARQVLFAATGLSCAILHNPRAYNKNVIEAEIERIVATSTAQVG